MPLRKNAKKYAQKNKFYYYICGNLVGIITVTLFCLTYYSFVLPKSFPTIHRTQQKFINNPRNFNIPILMYHYVEIVKDERDTFRQSMTILPWIFEGQIKTLKDANYTFLTTSDINLILENKLKFPNKPIILTFDDSYADFYTDVMPVLIKYKVRAVQYVITRLLDSPNYMSSDEIREIKQTGLVELACHTQFHPSLTTLDAMQAKKEIEGCKNDLKEKFGINAVSFAYPYGSYSPFLFSILESSGFKNAVTTEPGSNISIGNIYNIPRLRPGARVGINLTSYIESQLPVADNPFVKSANAQEKNKAN